MMLPPINLMIIGAQKAGTSSLHQYLAQHPAICTHTQREITYFINDSEYDQGYEKAFRRYFSSCWTDSKALLGKSVGIMYLPIAVERLYAHRPSAQLVICLRHPIKRAYSAFWYARRMGWEDLENFQEAIESNSDRFGNDWIRKRACEYLERSKYAEHMKMVYQIFPRSQVQVFLTDDMKTDIQGICNQIFHSIDLPAIERMKIERKHNPAALARSPLLAHLFSQRSFFKRILKKLLTDRLADQTKSALRKLNEKEFEPPPISQDVYEQLVNYFKPHNDALEELLKRDLSHWNNPSY